MALLITTGAGATRGMSSPGVHMVRMGNIGGGIITITTVTMINSGPTLTKPGCGANCGSKANKDLLGRVF
jgi:hypothetical protein